MMVIGSPFVEVIRYVVASWVRGGIFEIYHNVLGGSGNRKQPGERA